MEKPILIRKQKLKKGKPGISEIVSLDVKNSIEMNKKYIEEGKKSNAREEFIEVE